MPYLASNNWKTRRDNYFGASFLSLVNLLDKYKFLPICCNSDNGVNLFFVRKNYYNKFKELEAIQLHNIFESPHYALSIFSKTHKFSVSILNDISTQK